MELFLNSKGKPKYIQIYEQLKDKIMHRELVAGEKLPSIRYLAQELKLSKHTIDAAYQQLLAEGYIKSEARSGLYVLPIENFQITQEVIQKPLCINREKHPFIDFHYGTIDVNNFPLTNWSKCIKQAMEEDLNSLQYGEPEGDLDLREEIKKYVARSRGISCTVNQILINNGTQSSVAFIIQLLKLMNHPVFFENPGYNETRNVFQVSNCDIIPLPVENDGVCVSILNKNEAKALYVTPSHQFPLGSILSIQKRYELLKWAEIRDSYIIEDDYNSEFRYLGKPIPSLKSLDQLQRVIYLGTFSKSLLPAVRCSYMILPESIINKGRIMINQQTQNCSPILQKAIAIFMREGFFEKHVRKMKTTYQKKQQLLIKNIKEKLKDEVDIIGQQGGLHILLRLKNIDAETLINRARKVGVKLYSTRKYWMNSSELSNSYIMLGFGGLTNEEIVTGVTKLESCFK